MKKFVFVFVLFSLFVSAGYPQVVSEIFINSDPVNADVSLNGENLGRTPLRIKGSFQDPIKIVISKAGYDEIREEMSLDGLRRELFYYQLTDRYINLVIDQKDHDVFINNENAGRAPISVKNLPEGVYLIEKKNKGVYVSNRSSKQVKRTTFLETLFSAGLLGMSIGGRVHFSNTGEDTEKKIFGTSTIIFSGLLGYNLIKLYKIQANYKEDLSLLTSLNVEAFRADSAREHFTMGMEYVGKELWVDALTKFNFVANLYPDSEYTPLSFFEAGYCYYRMGNNDKAIDYFKRFVYDYPIYELFPNGVYYLVDLQLSVDRVSQAIEDYYNLRPIYLDDPSGEIYKEYYALLVELFQKTGEEDLTILTDLSDELSHFLNTHMNTPGYPKIYLLQGKLMYQYLDRQEGLRIFKDIQNNFSYDKNIITELESILNE
jgi:tetratricopeptide (TPR) repeat protein